MRDARVRTGLAIVAALVGFGIILAIVDRLQPEPEGPASSSYATSPEGLAAYASVLARSGVEVRRLRTRIAETPPREDETLVVLDPDVMEPEEAQAIGAWVRAGGRLVAGGSGDASWLDEVLGEPPVWSPGDPGSRRALVPVAETTGVRDAFSNGGGWREVGAALPAIGPPRAPLLVVASAGEGSVALLADATPLQNRALARADNAALGLALAGREVAFLETVHGYGVARGFGGLPARVRWTLLGLALTAIVAVWAAGRRFGETEDPDIEPPPPRVAYVDALAAALVRAKEDSR